MPLLNPRKTFFFNHDDGGDGFKHQIYFSVILVSLSELFHRSHDRDLSISSKIFVNVSKPFLVILVNCTCKISPTPFKLLWFVFISGCVRLNWRFSIQKRNVLTTAVKKSLWFSFYFTFSSHTWGFLVCLEPFFTEENIYLFYNFLYLKQSECNKVFNYDLM